MSPGRYCIKCLKYLVCSLIFMAIHFISLDFNLGFCSGYASFSHIPLAWTLPFSAYVASKWAQVNQKEGLTRQV